MAWMEPEMPIEIKKNAKLQRRPRRGCTNQGVVWIERACGRHKLLRAESAVDELDCKAVDAAAAHEAVVALPERCGCRLRGHDHQLHAWVARCAAPLGGTRWEGARRWRVPQHGGCGMFGTGDPGVLGITGGGCPLPRISGALATAAAVAAVSGSEPGIGNCWAGRRVAPTRASGAGASANCTCA